MASEEPSSANSSIAPSDRGEGAQQPPPTAYQQRPTSATPPVMAGTPSQPGDQGVLFSRLRAQVEFYFSPQNLARDSYLRNMLTAKHPEMPSPPPARLMTPIGVITNFPKVRDICASFGQSLPEPPNVLLARALEGSIVVTISPDAAWIGPASQQLPPMAAMGGPPLRGPTPQSHFQQGPYPPNALPPQRMMMGQGLPMQHPVQGEGIGQIIHQPMAYPGHAQLNAPPSLGSESPSSNSLESSPSQAKEVVFVAVLDLPLECDPLEILSAFATETVRPKSASVDANNTWYVAFGSEMEAKAALLSSSEKTIAGAPIRALLKSELPPPKLTPDAGHGASVPSVPETQQRMIPVPGVPHGAGPQMVQQPLPVQGSVMGPPPQGAYPLSHPAGSGPQPHIPVGNAHTPREMFPPPNAFPSAGGPHYPSGPYYSMPPMQVAGMPGQQFPPYYSSPQQIQQMHPYHVQQQGQQQMQPYPHPPPHHMGMRYGAGIPPPPPPRYPGPGGASGPGGMPPGPYPHQGVQHYGGGDGYGHYHGHAPQRQPGLGRGASIGSSTSDGGQRKKSDQGNKKKKQNRHQKRDSVASAGGGSDSDHRRGKNNELHHGFANSYRDESSSPNVAFGMQGESRGNARSRRGEFGEQNFRRSYGSSSPQMNRSQRQNSNSKLSGGATNLKKGNNADGDKDIFNASDFPGLGGDEKPADKSQSKSISDTGGFRGYADALLKKSAKEAEKSTEECTTKEEDYEADSITRQTEAMEREILSEFHDLSIRRDSRVDSANQVTQNNEADDSNGDNFQNDTGGASSNEAVEETPKNTKIYDLPILPGSFPTYDDVNESRSAESLSKPANDGVVCSPLPSMEPKNDEPTAQTLESVTPEEHESDSKPSDEPLEKPKPPGAWGTKRLFADVIKEKE